MKGRNGTDMNHDPSHLCPCVIYSSDDAMAIEKAEKTTNEPSPLLLRPSELRKGGRLNE